MATKKISDKFANMATIICTESAANTLTYKKLETSIGTFEKIAWVIHRLEYHLYGASTVFGSADDTVTCALMTGNVRTTIQDASTFTDVSVLDLASIARVDFGTAGSGFFTTRPISKDLSGLPSGGLIVPPTPLYGAIQGSGMGAATTMVIRVYYTILELATEEYWELVEARRLLTA
jgi:hypothetical protein